MSKCTRPEGRCELSTDTEDSLLCLAFRVCSFGSGAFARLVSGEKKAVSTAFGNLISQPNFEKGREVMLLWETLREVSAGREKSAG